MEQFGKIEEIKAKALSDLAKCEDEEALVRVHNVYLAKKSELSSLMGALKDIAPENRASYGKAVNDCRKAIEESYAEKEKTIKEAALSKKLAAEQIDITLPAREKGIGHVNPYYQIIDEMTDIFVGMGFEVKEGRDVETDHFNFELLNVPKDHPARDMQDTFYINDTLLLRTQTSAAQAHTMTDKTDKGPIRMICPGKCYRRDDDDVTHSHQFGQIEGLVVGKGVSLADLKGTLELFVKKMFGEKREIRLRSSYSLLPNPRWKSTFPVPIVAAKAAICAKGPAGLRSWGLARFTRTSCGCAATTPTSTAGLPLASALSGWRFSVTGSTTFAASTKMTNVF